LAIVKEIMKWHGGTVSVENRPLGGAIFTLRFTVTAGEDENPSTSVDQSFTASTAP
jgi:signal transduction histidine kinase